MDRYPSQILTKSQNLHCNSDSLYFKPLEPLVSYLFSLDISILPLFTFPLFQKKIELVQVHFLYYTNCTRQHFKVQIQHMKQPRSEETTDVKMKFERSPTFVLSIFSWFYLQYIVAELYEEIFFSMKRAKY